MVPADWHFGRMKMIEWWSWCRGEVVVVVRAIAGLREKKRSQCVRVAFGGGNHMEGGVVTGCLASPGDFVGGNHVGGDLGVGLF
jgi:hypothetical protein